jgi:hypothetical protein
MGTYPESRHGRPLLILHFFLVKSALITGSLDSGRLVGRLHDPHLGPHHHRVDPTVVQVDGLQQMKFSQAVHVGA